jgi:fructokinase
VQRFDHLGLDGSYLQRDNQHRTGTATVEVGPDGQPRFDITRDVAWDFIEWTALAEALAKRADAVCFGSLSQRGLRSRETIQRFIAETRNDAVRVFDANLRQAFYSADVLTRSAEAATILKLNHEEIPILLQALGGPAGDALRSARWLCRRFALKLVCVTRGSSGSLLVSNSEHSEHSGFTVAVADTVGSGDAFTATLVHHYLRGSNLATANEAANRMGSWVASQRGATPAPDPEVIQLAQVS